MITIHTGRQVGEETAELIRDHLRTTQVPNIFLENMLEAIIEAVGWDLTMEEFINER